MFRLLWEIVRCDLEMRKSSRREVGWIMKVGVEGRMALSKLGIPLVSLIFTCTERIFVLCSAS